MGEMTNFDRNFIGYNTSAVLTSHVSEPNDGILFASNTSNILFAHNKMIDTKKNEIHGRTTVLLKMEPNFISPIYGKK